jgi:hypothetical protein
MEKSIFLPLDRFKDILGLPVEKVFNLQPHRWAIIFGKKTSFALLLDFYNAKPSFHLTSIHPQTIPNLEVHRLSEMLKGMHVKAVTVDAGQPLVLTLQNKIESVVMDLHIQLAPFLPRLTLRKQDITLFDSIHGWSPKKPIHIRPSNWQEDQALNLEQWALTDQQLRYRNIIAKLIEKKVTRQQALENDASKHHRALGYQAIADAIKLSPLAPIATYPNPHQLPLPVDHDVGDYTFMNQLYHLYKKAKHGLEEVKLQQHLNQKHMETLHELRSRLEDHTQEALTEVMNRLKAMQLISGVHQKVEVVKADAPYWFIANDVRFSYGKNAKQNDRLTFSIAKKQEIFLHIKGKSGSHVILHHRNFDHDLIVLAAQLVLALANLTAGEVSYAKVGSLKATKILGQVIMKDYKTIKVSGQPSLMTQWLATSQRY